MRRILTMLLLPAAFYVTALRGQTTTPVSVERLDPGLDAILDTNLEISPIRTDYFGATEGPVWVKQGNYLLFSDIGGNKIYKWDPAAKQLSVYLEQSGYTGKDLSTIFGFYNGRVIIGTLGSNGTLIDREGRLVFDAH